MKNSYALRGGAVILGLACQSAANAAPAAEAAAPVLLAAAPMATAQQQQQEATRLSFTINSFEFEGNEKLDTAALHAVVTPHLGTGRHVDDLLAAKAAIVKAYTDAGFGMVAVGFPRRIEKDGVVRLRIVEVKPAKVRIVGNAAYSEANIRAQLPALVDGETPDMVRLEKQLQLANENPSRALRLEFQPGPSAGSADVAIQVSEVDPLRIGAYLDNTGNDATGKYRAGVIVHHANLWDKSHVASLSVITAPEKPHAVQQLGLNYLLPIAEWGDSVNFSASHSNIDNGLVANAFDVSGKGNAVGAHYRKNLWRDALSRHVLDVGLDLRQYKNTVNFFGFNLGVDVSERPLSVGYQYSARHDGLEWSLGLAHWHNLTGGARNDDATYAASRVGASAGWNLWRYNADLRLRTDGDWMGVATFSGQETRQPLIAGEQWGLGGARNLRGYAEREITGDSGQRLGLEAYGPRFAGNQRLMAFVDSGNMRRINPQVGELSRKSLIGYGAGWRWGEGGKGLNLSLDLAVAANDALVTAKNHRSTHLSAVWWF